jgi:catechol 2,3-dioxygenase-like lactoylglutathione lyase family enzyme
MAGSEPSGNRERRRSADRKREAWRKCHLGRAVSIPCPAMAALFSRIIPILFVGDLQAERRFYEALGFHVTYEGPEYPYFLALGHGKLEFGIEWRADFSAASPDRVLTWQFGVSDLELAKKRLDEAGVRYREELMAPSADWQYRVLHARTPNGYHLLLEEGSE